MHITGGIPASLTIFFYWIDFLCIYLTLQNFLLRNSMLWICSCFSWKIVSCLMVSTMCCIMFRFNPSRLVPIPGEFLHSLDTRLCLFLLSHIFVCNPFFYPWLCRFALQEVYVSLYGWVIIVDSRQHSSNPFIGCP